MSKKFKHGSRETLNDLYQYIEEVGGEDWLDTIVDEADISSGASFDEGFRRKVIISLVDKLDDISKLSTAIKVLKITASEFSDNTLVPDDELLEFRYLDALIYHHASELGIAEVKYRDLIDWMKDRSNFPEDQVLTVRAAFADLLSIQGKKIEAEAEQRDILKRRREIKASISQISNSQNSLSILLRDRGNLLAARRVQCLAYKRSRSNPNVNQATVLSYGDNLAATLIATGDLADAKNVLEAIIDGRTSLFGEGNAVTQRSIQRYHMVRSMEGYPDEAINGTRKTIDLLVPNYGAASIHVTQAKDNLAYYLIATDQVDEAMHLLEDIDRWNLDYLEREVTYSVRATTRRSTVTSLLNYQNTVLTMCLAKPTYFSSELAFRMVLTWKKFLTTHEEYRILNSDPEFKTRFSDLHELRSDVARIANQSATSSDLLSGAIHSFESAETEVFQSRSGEKRLITGSKIQEALPKNGVLLEFRYFDRYDVSTSRFAERRLSLAVLPKSGKVEVLDLGPASDIDSLIVGIADEMIKQSPTYSVDRRIDPTQRPLDGGLAVKELSALLLSMILPVLPSDTKTLVISTDGNLQAVPFDALFQHTGRRLIEQFDVRLVQAGRDLLREHKDVISNGFVGVCDVDSESRNHSNLVNRDRKTLRMDSVNQHHGLDQLPFSLDEVETIAELYDQTAGLSGPTSLLAGKNATRAKLIAHVQSPGILHFAVHGVLIEEGSDVMHPLLHTGLLISSEPSVKKHQGREKEVFFALEAPSLDLSETSLVVLSACETGLGLSDHSEGLEGLARSFLSSGARAVIVALWPVDDRMAMEFMIEFYHYWFNHCLEDPGKALCDVKRRCAVSTDPKRSSPTYWAPFVMYETGSLGTITTADDA